MIRRTPGSTRTHTLFPYTTLFRACGQSFWTGAEGLMMMVSAARIDLSQAGMEQDFPFSPEWQTAATRVAARVVVICRSDQIDWNSFIKVEIGVIRRPGLDARSEEHTSELQSLMRISYAVFCLKKKNTQHTQNKTHRIQ